MAERVGRFTGKTALVIGGASGTGLEIVRALHQEGASVVCSDLNPDTLANVEEAFPGVLCRRGDATREDDVVSLLEFTTDKLGVVDSAFNVVGGGRHGYIVDLSEADWDYSIDLSLKSIFLCMKHEARVMRSKDGPWGARSIVNIASLNSHVPMYGGSPYASGKAGVEMLTKNAALEFADGGVRVNAVLPGLIETPRTKRYFEDGSIHAAFMERIPARRAAKPSEIARPAVFLASEDASYISGASLIVDGAWAMTGYPDMRPFREGPHWPLR